MRMRLITAKSIAWINFSVTYTSCDTLASRVNWLPLAEFAEVKSPLVGGGVEGPPTALVTWLAPSAAEKIYLAPTHSMRIVAHGRNWRRTSREKQAESEVAGIACCPHHI